MVNSSLAARMRRLQDRLLNIRTGSGSYVLPADIKRIHLRFAARNAGGHMGPRVFWHNQLVRLKYHNPAISMTVDRSCPNEESPILSIHYAPQGNPSDSTSPTSSPAATESSTSSTAPSKHTPTNAVRTIDMRMRTDSEILDELVKITQAKPVLLSEEDRETSRWLEEQRQESASHRKGSLRVKAKVQREKELLRQAQGDMAVTS
nr:54s ribosomal protein mrp49, mitochondrial [Quercus suber]